MGSPADNELELRAILEDQFSISESGYGVEQLDDAIADLLAWHQRKLEAEVARRDRGSEAGEGK